MHFYWIRFGFALCFGWLSITSLHAADTKPEWTHLTVPGAWEENDPKKLGEYDGFAWYRSWVTIPKAWKTRDVELLVSEVGDVHEVYLNGQRIGSAGAFPPNYTDGSAENPRHKVPSSAILAGKNNLLAIKVYDRDGHGGFLGQAPVLLSGDQGIALNGQWEFHTGDDPAWKDGPAALTTTAIFWRVMSLGDALRTAQRTGAIPPEKAVETFTTPDDLAIDLLLAEPDVRQPLNMTFDERGRMWVIQYLQYPYPEGLKILSKDKFWRSVYDKVPDPPPHGPKGADKITIHEDTDGDGTFDKHKTFVEGLNIASSCLVGRGGVWVLNPPYLLFYPDKDQDDIPDGDPEVHLSGFGMEDTHSVANSLTWGPDGWIYGGQGSTVSGHIKKPGDDKNVTHSMGQIIWRYHPEKKIYEIFAEGGGNTFGVEIDAHGRTFSGHNGGNTRGFHYVQGGYYRKGFGKHGPLSNPFTFGYFEHIKHHNVPRFTHNFVIYEDRSLPEAYRENLFGIEPLQGRVVRTDISTLGSTFQSKDIGFPVTTTDRQFRPVDIKVGPDGAIYLADFYEPQISHREHFSGQIDKSNGRVFRLRSADYQGYPTQNLGELSSKELVEMLKHPSKWFRREALRLLGDRKDEAIIPLLSQGIDGNDKDYALECLWALHQTVGLDDATLLKAFQHQNPHVRLWAVRLACDDHTVSTQVAYAMAELAKKESNVEVRSQLACSARRLTTENCLRIITQLIQHDEDEDDPHVPLLLWWAIEAHAEKDREAIVGMFANESVWARPLVENVLAGRLMQRYASAGKRSDLLTCAELFAYAPNKNATAKLLAGFEKAFQGRSLSGLPEELTKAIANAGGGSLALNVRLGDQSAVNTALERISNPKTPIAERIELARIFGEIDQPTSVPVLLGALKSVDNEEFQQTVLAALPRYSDERIGRDVLGLYESFSAPVQTAAQGLLASRAKWAKMLVDAVANEKIPTESVSPDLVRRMTLHRDEKLAASIKSIWPSLKGASDAQMQARIAELAAILENQGGDPSAGKKLYATSCGKCHILFGEGGRIGPALTTYNRDDTLRILLNVVNPSAEIREGFESYLVLTDDGRTASGFLFDQDNRVVVLRGVDGQSVTIERDQIIEMIKQPKSLMPEGLLKSLSKDEIRNLFAYLRSAQPLN
ncbi:PVC-type heme-binding CxxCH protein [Thalassoroseus pseudoceratinae]|uniref:PVC-type heme-binding CxxCH protein n=1 Tax=Thalassoroseus pseudoceratinae TaxID=2713176 RepID=UPI00141F7065|nr:PVC-type heme-binding CxxCH protein [Thalassoroseus pseudoceratinae]